MKKFLALLALLTGIAASATSLTVTIPSTMLSDDSTIAGSFTYDTVTPAVSNVSITAAGNVYAGTYTVLGGNVSPGSYFYARETGAAGSELGGKTILIEYFGSGFPVAGGSSTLVNIRIGTCSDGDFNGCYNGSYIGQRVGSAVTVTAPFVPAPVPTLSEWAMISFALLIAGFGIYQQRRRES